jgi:hypothetical protein
MGSIDAPDWVKKKMKDDISSKNKPADEAGSIPAPAFLKKNESPDGNGLNNGGTPSTSSFNGQSGLQNGNPFSNTNLLTTVDLKTPSGAVIPIDKNKIPAVYSDKDNYIQGIQKSINENTLTPFDAEIISASATKNPKATTAYLQGDNTTGAAIDRVDYINKNKEQLTSIINDYNKNHNESIIPDALLADPDKLSTWAQNYQNILQRGVSDNTVGGAVYAPIGSGVGKYINEIDAKKAVYSKQLADFLEASKPLIDDHIVQSIASMDISRDEQIKRIAQLTNPIGYANAQQAINSKRDVSDQTGFFSGLGILIDEIKGNQKQEEESLNSQVGYADLALNDAYKTLANNKAAEAHLSGDENMMQQAKDIYAKVDDSVIGKYPAVLKSQMADEIAKQIATESGMLSGTSDEPQSRLGIAAKYNGIDSNMVKEFVQRNGWDKDPARKDAAEWLIEHPESIKDASMFGGVVDAAIKPFKDLGLGILDAVDVRGKRDVITDKIKEQLFPNEFNPDQTKPQFTFLGNDVHVRGTLNSITGLAGMTAIAVGTGIVGKAANLGLDALESAELASAGTDIARKGELLAKLSATSERAAGYTSFAIPSIDQNLKASYDNPNITNDAQRALFVSMGAILNGEGGRVLNLGSIGNVPGLPQVFVEAAKGLSEKTITKEGLTELLKKGETSFVDYAMKYATPIVTTTLEAAEKTLKGAATMAYFTASDKILKMGFGDPNAKAEDLIPEAGHAFIDGILTMMPFGFVQAIGSPEKNPNSSFKQNIYDMARMKDATQDIFKLNKKSEEDYNSKMQILNTAVAAKNALDAGQTENNILLNPQQRASFVANKTVEGFLRDKAEKIVVTDEKTKAQKDKLLSQAEELKQQGIDTFKGLQFTKTLEPLYDLYNSENEFIKQRENVKSGVPGAEEKMLEAKRNFIQLQLKTFNNEKLSGEPNLASTETATTKVKDTETANTEAASSEVKQAQIETAKALLPENNPALQGTDEEKIKFIAEQAQNVQADGTLSSLSTPEESYKALVNSFGKPLVDAAIAVHPLESLLKKENKPQNEAAKEQPVSTEPLKDVESTAKSLGEKIDFKKAFDENGRPSGEFAKIWNTIPYEIHRKITKEIADKNGKNSAPFNEIISEAYHKAKADNSNPELVKAVEEALTPKTEIKAAAPVSAVSSEVVDFNLNDIKKPSGRLGEQGMTEEGAREVIKRIGVTIPGKEKPSLKDITEHLKSNPADLKKLVDYVKANPIQLLKLPDGSYDLTDGNHRAGLLYYSGVDNAPAIIKDASNSQVEAKPYAGPLGGKSPENKPIAKTPTNKKERLAAFKKNYVEPAQTEAEVKTQWSELSMAEKLALAKENLPEVDKLSNVEIVKIADANAKMLLAKLNKPNSKPVAPNEAAPVSTVSSEAGSVGVGGDVKVSTDSNGKYSPNSIFRYFAKIFYGQRGGFNEFTKSEINGLSKEAKEYLIRIYHKLKTLEDSYEVYDAEKKLKDDVANGKSPYDITKSKTFNGKDLFFDRTIVDNDEQRIQFARMFLSNDPSGRDNGITNGISSKTKVKEFEYPSSEVLKNLDEVFNGDSKNYQDELKAVEQSLKEQPKPENKPITNEGRGSNQKINENEPIIADDPAENKIAVAKLTEKDNPEQEPNVKAIEQQAENPAGVGSKELNKALDQANELVNAAIDVVNVPISEIKTNEKEYQGRKNKFSERSARKVAEQFDKNKLQPIVVYKHPDGNTYVLSGHSRLEGMKRRNATTIPATYFEGTPQEAIDFSQTSNKQATLQTDIENAAYYRKKLLSGESYNSILKEAKENEQEGSAKRIVSIAHLNPNGKAMQALEALDKGEGDTKNNILNVATKIGDIRAKNDHLTDAHENELFDFMVADKKNIPTDKDLANASNTLNRSINNAKFSPTEPLNLDRVVNKSDNRIQWEKELRELEQQQSELKAEVNPSKKTGWTGLKERAIGTLAAGDRSPEGIDKAVAAFEANKNGIKDNYQKALEKKRAELQSVNDKLAKHLLREKDLIQGDKAQQSLFAIQEPTSQQISDMKDIVKDYVDEGTASLQDIQNEVAKELDDDSQGMKDLVEKAYNEITKSADFAPKEVTGGVIGKVGKFLSRLFGGTAASKVFIAKDEKALMDKAATLSNVSFMKSPNGKVLGFAHEGKIYLNGEQLNTNTPIHEAGHIWQQWAKQNNPEVYNRGIELTKNSKYLKAAKENKFYQQEAEKLPADQREEYFQQEALATAIGDKGAQFIGETRKKDFKEWLTNLWNKIKAAAGFKDITAAELQNLTFDEFTKRAAADILGDKEITQPQDQQQETNTADTGAGKPPVGNNSDTGTLPEDNTGIAHAATEEVRKRFGLGDYERNNATDAELKALADEAIQKGYNPETLLKQMEAGIPPTGVENFILKRHLATLEATFNKNPTDANLAPIERLVKATDKIGSLQSEAFRTRKGTVPIDDSLAGFFITEKETNLGAPLTDAQKEKVESEHADITEKDKNYKDAVAKLEAENARLKAEQSVKKQGAKNTKPTSPKKTHEDFVKDRKSIIQKAKDKIQAAKEKANSSDAPKTQGVSGRTYLDDLYLIAPDVLELVKSYVDEGVTNLGEIIRNVHPVLQDTIPDITERDVHDIIAGEYNKKARTKTDAAKDLYEVKLQAQLINKLERLLNGTEPKVEREKIIRNKEIESLRSQIKDFKKENPDTKAQLKTLKTKAENELKIVEAELKAGKFAEPVKKTPLLYDSELKKEFPELHRQAVEAQNKLIKAKQERQIRLTVQQYENRSKYEKLKDQAVRYLNVPRTIMASMDYSAPLRQAVVVTVAHPGMALKAGLEMFKQSFSQNKFDRWAYDLKETERYQLMTESGLSLTDPHSLHLQAQEEAFMGNVAEKIPIAGALIKGSERAYVSYLNKMRSDLFNRYADVFEENGRTFENSPELYKGLASYINNSTGRGGLGVVETAAPVLNTLLFSPRLIASRFNMLGLGDIATMGNGFYGKLPKEVRILAMKDMAKFVAAGIGVLALAKLGGAKVEDDPRSSDFGKIKSGNTRWDIWGGFQPYVRVIAQVIAGERKSTNTGKIIDISSDKAKFGASRVDPLVSFGRGKLAPVPALIWDLLSDRTIQGNKILFQWGGKTKDKEITLKDEAIQHFLPLIYSDVAQAVKDNGISSLFTVGIPSTFGVGVQTYAPKKK